LSRLEIHLLELPRYTLNEDDLASATPVERWVFLLGERQNESYPPLASLDPPVGRVKSLSLWESRPERPERVCVTLVVFNLPLALRYAQDYDAEALRRLFPEVGFSQAIDTFEAISLTIEDRQMYETRDKAARDRLWLMNGAIKETENKGREEGRLAGIIQTSRSILGMTELSPDEFGRLSPLERETMARDLQAALRGRNSGD